MSALAQILDVYSVNLASKTGSVVGCTVPVEVSSRDTMADPRPSNRIRGSDGHVRFYSESAVEFYRRNSYSERSSWSYGRKTELAPSSVDSTSHTKVEDPTSKFISASYAGPDTNGSSSQRYSRRKALKKMRLNNDRKIISYLRKRFRERADPWMDDETIESDSQGDKTYKFKPRTPGKVDIFAKYNEIGGRVSKEGHIVDGLYPGAFSFTPLPNDHPPTPDYDESVPANGAVDKAPETSQDDVNRTVETRASPILEPLTGAGADQPLFQKGNPPATSGRLDKAPSEKLELQSISDSMSSMGSRNSSGRSRMSSGISRDGSVAGTIASSSRTPKPPELAIKADKSAKGSPMSPLAKSPSHLSHLPTISTSRVSSPLAAQSGKDLKLPSLGMDTRCHSTVSAQGRHSVHQNPADDHQVLSCVSPVPTPYPEDGLESRRSMEYQEVVDSILKSHVDVRCSWVSNIFRLYVSSTFTDFGAERAVLVAKAYPRLRAFCRDRGFEFQVCDMNWGLKDYSTDDHAYAASCLAELGECERVSKGPFFVTLMGQKMGYQALPDSFPVEDFSSLVSAIEKDRDHHIATRRPSMFPTQSIEEQLNSRPPTVESKKDGTRAKRSLLSSVNRMMLSMRVFGGINRREVERLPGEGQDDLDKGPIEKEFDADLNALQTWYKQDENSVPPLYVLQPISSQFREILSNDKQKRLRAKNQWIVMYKRIIKTLTKYVPMAVKDTKRAESYLQTVNERELDHAVFSAEPEKSKKVASFVRHIKDLRKNLQDYNAKDFIDLQNLKPDIDFPKFERAEDLRDVKVPSKIGFSNVHEHTIMWHKDGVSPTHVRAHSQYLDGLANEFFDTVKVKLERAMLEDKSLTSTPSYGLYEEVAQHVNFLQERSQCFYGRKEPLQYIKEYLLSDSHKPLVLCGLAGRGKTSLIAKACQLTKSWFKERDAATIVRFVGLTAESENIRCLLQGICQQIGHTYDMDLTAVPEDFYALINDLEGRIAIATTHQPLVIYIDGPDKLSNDYKARSMVWLPSNLPENVKIVISCTTLEEEKTDSFKALKKQCLDADFYTIPDLTQEESKYIVNYLLKQERRRITQEQHETVMKALEEISSPLYLRLVCDQAVRWRSFSEKRETYLATDLKKMLNGILISLETKHGEPLVRRCLGYLTAARSGLSWTELNDILSCDEHVMTDIAKNHSPTLRRMPPALWCRLKADLRKLFRVWKVNGVWVWRWADQQFREAATERYLNQKDKAPSYHSALGEYFMGKWADRKKPYPGNEGGADRFINPQPLLMTRIKPSGQPYIRGVSVKEYNMRKLNELPHHLLHASQLDKLKSEVLINYEWTLAKLRAVSLRAIQDDLQSALTVHPDDLELRLMSSTLHLSTNALLKDPNQLASQLVGRLLNIITNDKPMSIGDPKKYPTIASMLNQAQRSSTPALIPSVSCLAQPGGVLYDLLAGHTEVITAVTVSRLTIAVAATASRDASVKLWDLKNRKVLKTIEGVGKEISSIRLCKNDTIAVTVESSRIKFNTFSNCTCLLEVTQYIDPPVITTASENDDLVVALFTGSNVMRTWDVSGESIKSLVEVDIGGHGIHKDESLSVSFSPFGERVLFAYRSSNTASVVNARTGNKVHKLSPPKPSASITALGVSKDYYVVACRYMFQKVSEIHQLELFDIKNGAYLRAVTGCTTDIVNELYVNRLGSHAVSVCPNPHTNTTTLAVWNLETEDHKHLAKHAQMSKLGACMDLLYCLTASQSSKSLRIWNISKKVNERDENANRSKKNLGVTGLVPMINNPRYVVAKSVKNGPLSVWNVVKGKCAGNAVRIERGLVDSHDIVLIRNHKVVILSDLGMSSVSEKPSQVFQTVFMYDLGTKKYIRKLTGVFIVPSPAHEYRLLDGELLLGLSETRDHFIAWNLESGHIKFRIKTGFKTDRLQRKKEVEELRSKLKRQNTAEMMPWERRSESQEERQKRKDMELEKERKRLEDLRKEKENAIQQYLMSKDEKVLVCSYFGHHLCVFNVETQQHLQTVENESSMLYLYVAALSPEGKYLAHVNYDDNDKVSYVTVWNLHKGEVRKRLKREPNVCCIGMNDNATRVLFGNERHQLKVWDIQRGRSTLRRLRTSTQSLQFTTSSKIFMIDDGARAVIVASDITLWDLDHATQLAMFTPDLRISCVEVVMSGQMILLGLQDSSDVVTLRLKGRDIKPPDFLTGDAEGKELFGETTGDTSPEDEEEEEEEEEEDY
ncbi:uncharacterized protein LOC121417179 isoform X3 [Lytechinus variegatus]|uniref:uncharacterized protein LOC121417179 isoform X3 n=1 Tax=Lytechinus variegatus TaxID=7654 RepID=UPI001BB28271|nr:uncharacterized protein LOC121417179 isoform X3 [Lytechinus variegatus]